MSKLLAIIGGGLLAGFALVGHRGESSLVAEPVLLLTVVGLALAGVVVVETVTAATRVVGTADSLLPERPVGYRRLRTVEAIVASCVLGGVFVWLTGSFGGQPVGGADQLEWLAVLAGGMVAASLVRSTAALRCSRRRDTDSGE